MSTNTYNEHFRVVLSVSVPEKRMNEDIFELGTMIAGESYGLFEKAEIKSIEVDPEIGNVLEEGFTALKLTMKFHKMDGTELCEALARVYNTFKYSTLITIEEIE